MAPYYDDDYADLGRQTDQAFYLALVQQLGTTVVDIGCGTGRIAIPAAEINGTAVLAVDRSPAMLAVLADRWAKRPRSSTHLLTIVGDMCNLPVRNGSANLALAAFRVVQHLSDHDALTDFFAECYRLLTPGGHLALDVFQPDIDLLENGSDWSVDIERSGESPDQHVRRWSRARPCGQQAFDLDVRWEFPSAGLPTVEATARILWYRRDQVLSAAGRWFTLKQHYGDFDRTPPSDNAPEQVFVFERRQ